MLEHDQHLLRDAAAVRTLVELARPVGADIIADLGAGAGVITRELLRHQPARIYAVELDRGFTPFLQGLERADPRVELIWGDLRTAPLSGVTKVVANPPFRLTEQLVERLGRLPRLAVACLVLGTPFARCAVAPPGSDAYTRISLKVQARFTVEVFSWLRPEAFDPPARGGGRLVRLLPRRPPPWLEVSVADAVTYRGGLRVKELLWWLRSAVVGSAGGERQRAVRRLRESAVVRELYQRRLQQLTSMQLSRLMAEVRSVGQEEVGVVEQPLG